MSTPISTPLPSAVRPRPATDHVTRVPEPEVLTGAQAVVRTLELLGVTDVFGLPEPRPELRLLVRGAEPARAWPRLGPYRCNRSTWRTSWQRPPHRAGVRLKRPVLPRSKQHSGVATGYSWLQHETSEIR